MNTFPKVSEAIQLAKRAVDADTQGDYAKAVELYKRSIVLIESELPRVPSEHKPTLQSYALKYTSRIAALEKEGLGMPSLLAQPARPPSPKRKEEAKVSHYPITFKEETSTKEYVPHYAPSNDRRRPYWLMSTLARTMTQGDFVTRSVYVPSYVWFQNNARFVALQQKQLTCETLLDMLPKLEQVDLTDSQALLKELDVFYNGCIVLQNSLAQGLSFVPVIDVEERKEPAGAVARFGDRVRTFGHAVSRGATRLATVAAKSVDNTKYIQLLTTLFQRCQFLDTWMDHFEKAGCEHAVTIRLDQISEFFYRVICAFVIRDFNMLLRRYMKKAREDFSRFMP